MTGVQTCALPIYIDRQWQSEPSLPGKAPNVEVAMDLDQEKFNEVLLDTLRRYSET